MSGNTPSQEVLGGLELKGSSRKAGCEQSQLVMPIVLCGRKGSEGSDPDTDS